jgi:ZIP family zinc transporter
MPQAGRFVTWIAIPFACLTVVTTLIGGWIALRLSHNLPTVIAFTGGIVVAVALFDVLPEAIDAIGDSTTTATLVGVGFLGFFLIERILILHHRDDPEQARAHHQVGALGATGLAIHSFIDGLGIGLAFGLNTETGILVFVAVAAHDFADGMNMVSFVLMQSGDRTRARRWLAVDALAPLLGTLVGASVAISENALGHILALYAGFFIYLGATDLIPEAHHEHASWLRVTLTVAGFALIYAVVRIAGV